jgi:hypothetical protein
VTDQATAPRASQEQLDREAADRPKMALVAGAAAVLTLLGGVLLLINLGPNFEDRTVTLVEALGANAAGQTDIAGANSARLQYLVDRPVYAIGRSVPTAIAALLLFVLLGYLHRATAARRVVSRLPMALAGVGAVAYGIGTLVTAILLVTAIPTSGDLSGSAINDAVADAGSLQAGRTINALGAMALGAGALLVSLNAMRVGLLSRFLGVLGIIVGGSLVLTGVFPIDQQGLIRTFWLGGLALMLAGRLPGGAGLPPAWASGVAEPWEPRAGAPAPLPPKKARARSTPEPEVPAPEPRAAHPSSKKRRKRRR